MIEEEFYFWPILYGQIWLLSKKILEFIKLNLFNFYKISGSVKLHIGDSLW